MMQLIVDVVFGAAAGMLGAIVGICLERRHQARVQLARVWRRPFHR